MSTDNATKTDLLSLKDRLNKLDAMADDPWGHDPVEWDGAYADAQYEARACKGMAMGAQAHDIAERFKRAGKRFHACAALDLVPAEKAVSFSMDVRMAKADSIGPGDPLPPPPPPTKALEPWTVDRLKLVFDERDMLFDMEDDAAELVVELIKNNGGAANERVGTKAP